MNQRIAIHRSRERRVHSGSWSFTWIAECEVLGIDYEVVDCYAPGFLDRMCEFDVLLFHFGNYTRVDMEFARHILAAAKLAGLRVFPDYGDAWHFDDKVGQSYALQALGAPVPEWAVFYGIDDLQKWLASRSTWPVVAKLRTGSGSHNVKLLNSVNDALGYAKKMFGSGLNSSPSLTYKALSNAKSSRSLEQFIARVRRAPEFIRTLSRAKQFDRQRGYVYVQEFVPNDGFDAKIVVAGDKVSYFLRKIRKGDFRASGGGDIFYDRSVVPSNVIDSARRAASALGARCMGFDYVVDRRSGVGRIIEMSYGFSHPLILGAGGHWKGDGSWDSAPLNAPAEILRGLVSDLEREASHDFDVDSGSDSATPLP